ncbi:MAG: transposase [Chloroflexi bacterium]|nr:transposase [Chloroflexota bacterium]
MLWFDPFDCLMNNHFHLVVETPDANLVEGMRWLLSAYTIRLNHRHKLFGHLFSGRYKALLVEGSGHGYLKTVSDDVHLNPVRAGLLRPAERHRAYPWSSFVWHLSAPEHRPPWIRVDRWLGEHGLAEDTPVGQQEFERRMEGRRLEAPGNTWAHPRAPTRGCMDGCETRRWPIWPLTQLKQRTMLWFDPYDYDVTEGNKGNGEPADSSLPSLASVNAPPD